MGIDRRRGLMMFVLLALAPSAQAADETTVVREATRLLDEIASNPDSGIPPQALRDARGIMIMPHIRETHLGIGGKRGHGVFLSRNEKGEWGRLEPVDTSKLSVGGKAGREIMDRVIIFRSQKAIESYKGNRFALELGFQFGGVLKPRNTGRFWGPGPDESSRKETLDYVRRRHGWVVGAALSGETRHGPPLAPSDRRAGTGTDAKVPESKSKDRLEAATAAKRAPDSPEVTRLEAVLTAMTTPPPAVAAKKATRDEKVRTASGNRQPAESAHPTR